MKTFPRIPSAKISMLISDVDGTLVTDDKILTARTQAAAWAQSLLDSAYVMAPPQPGTTAGRFDATYRWRLDVQPWQAPRASSAAQKPALDSLRLYKLDLAVMWGTPPRQHVAHFATLRVVRPRPTGDLP